MDMKRVYDDAYERENGSFKTFQHCLSACIKGTAIIEEGYSEKKKTIKEIDSIDHETGKVIFTKKEVIENGRGEVYGDLVPLLNFYPNENSPEIEHDCVRMSYPTIGDFNKKYGKYPEAKYVSAGITASDIDNIEYNRVKDDRTDIVEIMKYYNEDDDEFVILANGIWVNPQENDETCPIPFDHKKLPFTKLLHEYADEECFYGKAFPDLMAGEQDTSNAILRMVVDQEILAIHKPILMGQGIELESTNLFPGKQMRATGDVNQIRELQMSGASQSSMLLLDYLERRANVNTAVDPNSQGVHQGRKTAKEAIILDENSKRINGIFQIFIYKSILDRARLRISNIKQFYQEPVQFRPIFDPETGQQIKDKNGTPLGNPVYRQIPVNEAGQKPYWLEISPELCRSNFEIRVEEDYEVSNTRSQRIEIARLMLDEAKANPLLSADEATIEWLKALGKNPQKFYIRPDQATQSQGPSGPPGPQGGRPDMAAMMNAMGGANQPNQAQQ
jgi:hypothetical protein